MAGLPDCPPDCAVLLQIPDSMLQCSDTGGAVQAVPLEMPEAKLGNKVSQAANHPRNATANIFTKAHFIKALRGLRRLRNLPNDLMTVIQGNVYDSIQKNCQKLGNILFTGQHGTASSESAQSANPDVRSTDPFCADLYCSLKKRNESCTPPPKQKALYYETRNDCQLSAVRRMPDRCP